MSDISEDTRTTTNKQAKAADAKECCNNQAKAADAKECGNKQAKAADAKECGNKQAEDANDKTYCNKQVEAADAKECCNKQAKAANDKTYCNKQVEAADAKADSKNHEKQAGIMDVAVRVSKLGFAYPGGKSILRDISFDVKKGSIFVIAGHSGCGKSTLCNIISGIIPNTIKGSVSGNVEVLGQNMRGRSLAENSKRVGFVFQNVDLQFVCTTVEDELAFGLENLCVEPSEIKIRVDEMLDKWKLEQFRLRNPGSLSGGQKRIVAIASVLILNPEVLILDEPMSHLDEPGREIVRNAAKRLRSEGKTVIMVEHDLSLAEYADYWLLIDNGSVAAKGTPADIKNKSDILKRLEFE